MKFSPSRIKVGLELTSKCNLRCGMCPLPVLRRPYEDMEWPLVEKAEREIHGLGLRLKWLHEMGEPLLYSRIDDAIRLFPEASVSTNGLVLTEEVGAKLLASPLKRLRICVDSVNPDVYPQLRTGGDFDKLVDLTRKFLKQAKGHPIRIEIQKMRSRLTLDDESQLELMRRCRELSLKVSVLPQVFETLGPSVEVDDVEGITLLGLHPPVLSRSSRFLKRSVDVLGSGLLLVVLAPLMALIALAVKLDSKGPVFFAQERIGKEGRRFKLRKFRTMVVGAEALAGSLRAQSKDPDWLHLEHDPRITWMGRHLRQTSLDELPQLWNVLVGEMSLVGPRPLIESEDRLIGGWGRSRLQLTPGITGSWQVLGRTSIPFEEMVKLDYLYVANWSLWTDIRLILRTLPAVVTRRGVN
jgi:exopolysaccharide biosynthesis polyprenyl glycosylphosphotransferase